MVPRDDPWPSDDEEASQTFVSARLNSVLKKKRDIAPANLTHTVGVDGQCFATKKSCFSLAI